MARAGSTISIADLIGSVVVTAEGERVGHVVDLRVTPGSEYRVTALEVGRAGWLERLDVFRTFAHALRIHHRPRTIPWEAVDCFESCTVTLKPGSPRESPSVSE